MAFASVALILLGTLFLMSAFENTSVLGELSKWTHIQLG